MYQPPHFKQHDGQAIRDLVAAHPLASLVRHSAADGLVADPVPMLLEDGGEHGVLRGHVARANPLWRHDGEVMAVFQGPHGYVSPSWYADKAVHGRVVPTWNYAVVQVHGRLRAVEDADWLMGLLGRLTDHHETGRPARWQVQDAPADFTRQLLKVIVGIEVEITRIEAKWKVSQNRTPADQQTVLEGLLREPSAAARAMGEMMSALTGAGTRVRGQDVEDGRQ
jgi:transcriptional regulator